ncbi:hypothetical protein [Nocardioides sp. P5_C9_2]
MSQMVPASWVMAVYSYGVDLPSVSIRCRTEEQWWVRRSAPDVGGGGDDDLRSVRALAADDGPALPVEQCCHSSN